MQHSSPHQNSDPAVSDPSIATAGQTSPKASFSDCLKALPQYLYPQHLLSALMLRIAKIRVPWIKNQQIRRFAGWYRVDMQEAHEPDLGAYDHFNQFFTRALHPDARPLPPAAGTSLLVSPADGCVSEFGTIHEGRIFQAKGHGYTVSELLRCDDIDATAFSGGQFITIYLSPRDYHRVHIPVAGHLRKMRHVPGRLFSVNASTTRVIPRLFARNERVVMHFDTTADTRAQGGEKKLMALVMVGAIFVGSIETVWAGTVTPSHVRSTRTWQYDELQQSEYTFQQGQEIGRFNMGSTVILLFPPDTVTWDPSLYPGAPLRMGMPIGRFDP